MKQMDIFFLKSPRTIDFGLSANSNENAHLLTASGNWVSRDIGNSLEIPPFHFIFDLVYFLKKTCKSRAKKKCLETLEKPLPPRHQLFGWVVKWWVNRPFGYILVFGWENWGNRLGKGRESLGKEAFFFALEWPLNMDLTGKLKTQTKILLQCSSSWGFWGAVVLYLILTALS